MDVTGQDSDWRSPAFRQKLVSQIDEAIRKAGVAHNKSSKDMESHVFLKAKTREEYLSLVARLIIHFRDIRNNVARRNQCADCFFCIFFTRFSQSELRTAIVSR
uniref:Mediator of RNA polymerase II transcription subunit 15 n=1 Tax=Leptobrachium leishanense TaxID=445787 RepID=A0A8C5P699_9ANUR